MTDVSSSQSTSPYATLEAIVSAFCKAVGEPIPQDAICKAQRLREAAEAVDAHYSASLDFQPVYVRMARDALRIDYDR